MAMAFDSVTTLQQATDTSLTFSHTCSGTNRILFVAVLTRASGADICTGVTYNGTAMTRTDSGSRDSFQRMYLYMLVNPASGTHDVVISCSESNVINGYSASYTGAAQSGQPDNHNVKVYDSSNVTATSDNITPNTDGCWVIAAVSNNQDVFVAPYTGTSRMTTGTAGYIFIDTNSPISPAANTTLAATIDGSVGGHYIYCMVSIAVASEATTSTSSSTSVTTTSSSITTTSSSITTTTTSSSITTTSSSSSSSITTTSSSSSITTTTSSSSITTTTSSSSISTSTTTTTSSSTSITTTSSSSSSSITTTSSSSSITTTSSSSSLTTTSSSSSSSITTTSSSITTTSSSSSVSTSTSTTIAPTSGGLAFGEQNPTMGESPVSWQTFDNGAAVVPTIVGDQDWGQMKLVLNEQGRSRVYDFSNQTQRTITITIDRYQAGSGSTRVVQMRGQPSVFLQDDDLPPWEAYSIPINKTWRFIQVRAINAEGERLFINTDVVYINTNEVYL